MNYEKATIKILKLIKNDSEKYFSDLENYLKDTDCKERIRKANNYKDLLYYLSEFCFQKKELKLSERLSLELFNIDQDYSKNLFLIGKIYFSLGEYSNALKFYKKYEVTPYNNELLLNISLCYQLLGDNDIALEYLNKYIKLDNKNYNALNNRGYILNELKLYSEAIQDLNTCIEIDPLRSEAFNNLGKAYFNIKNYKKAIESYTNSIKLKIDDPNPYNNLGGLYFNIGKKDEATDIYLNSLKINKNNSSTFRSLALSNGINLSNDISKRFIKIFQETENKLSDRQFIESHNKGQINACLDDLVNIGFGLGYLHDKEQEFDKAFNYFAKSNNIFRSSYKYDINIEEKLFDEIIKVFDSDFFSHIDTNNIDRNDEPIFIIGMPRSGTTLLEQIISNHSQVYGSGEIEYIKETANKCLNQLPDKSLNRIRELTENHIISLGNFYLDKVFYENTDFKRFTDKQMLNFIYVGFIRMIFPNSKIINIERNPLDTCLSIFFLKFNGHHPYAYNLVELANYYKLYQRIINHWKMVMPNKFINVKYEDLVGNLEENVKKILDYCNLDFEKSCVEFYNNKRSVITSSSLQVRKKIYNSSINRWKNYEDKIEPLINILN